MMKELIACLFPSVIRDDENMYVQVPIGIHVPGVPLRVEKQIGFSIFRLLGDSAKTARRRIDHEFGHIRKNPHRLHIVSAVFTKGKVVGAGCDIVDATPVEIFKGATGVGMQRMSGVDWHAAYSAMQNARGSDREQMMDKVRKHRKVTFTF